MRESAIMILALRFLGSIWSIIFSMMGTIETSFGRVPTLRFRNSKIN